MNRKLYQSKPFETEGMNVFDIAERLARVNASDCRRATGPVSVVIHENTEDSLRLSLCDGIQSLCRKVPIQEIQNHPPILHKHNYYEMTFVLRGEVDIRIEDEVHRYQQGDVCLLNRNAYHVEQVCSNVTLAFLCFSPQMMVEYSGYPFADFYPKNEMDFAHFFESDCENCPEGTKSFLEFHRCTQEGQGAAEELLFQIRQELLLHQPGCMYMLYGLMTRLLFTLAQAECYCRQYTEVKTAPDLDLVQKIQQYVEGRRCRFSRKEIEETLHYNRDYLNRIFRQYTGFTLGDYCRTVCMEEAAHRLLHTSDTIERIAEQVGFPNRTQFYRVFQQYYHTTPCMYRKTKRQEAEQQPSEACDAFVQQKST